MKPQALNVLLDRQTERRTRGLKERRTNRRANNTFSNFTSSLLVCKIMVKIVYMYFAIIIANYHIYLNNRTPVQTYLCLHSSPVLLSSKGLFVSVYSNNKQSFIKQNRLILKTPRKPASKNVVCLCRLLNILAKLFKPIFAYRQTVWTLIRLLLEEQSDLGPHCLQR